MNNLRREIFNIDIIFTFVAGAKDGQAGTCNSLILLK
jgi:hypothetical protein